ncbi:MAG: recombination mediator RecR [Fidelibacterota bacterium]
MQPFSDSISKLIDEFSKFPGIGRKTASRLAFHVLKLPKKEVISIVNAMIKVKERVKYCSVCYNMTEKDPCEICSNPERDNTTICVVEEPADVFAFEKTNQYKGLYHVLGGVISPMEGIEPENLKIKELLNRLKNIKEVIIATNPSVEGETTTIYLTKLLKPKGIKVSRIARGVPMGSDLEFTDAVTLTRALEGRVSL